MLLERFFLSSIQTLPNKSWFEFNPCEKWLLTENKISSKHINNNNKKFHTGFCQGIKKKVPKSKISATPPPTTITCH